MIGISFIGRLTALFIIVIFGRFAIFFMVVILCRFAIVFIVVIIGRFAILFIISRASVEVTFKIVVSVGAIPTGFTVFVMAAFVDLA